MWFILLWGLLQPAIIEPGVPVTVMLTAGAGPVDVLYAANADERVTITARSRAAEPVDVTLEVLWNEQHLAFSDDHPQADAELGPLDSAVTDLHLREAGEYTLRVHSFSGAQSGEVEIQVEAQPVLIPCELPAQSVTLKPRRGFACQITLEAGQMLTLTARDTSGTLDPMIALLDSEGRQLASNDDHDGADLTLNVLDARIPAYTIPADCICQIQVRDFAGAAGGFELALEIES